MLFRYDMPAQPQWLLRVPEIIEELSALDIPVVDRAIIESIFKVRRRRALQLLASFGGYQAGRTFLVDRRKLICALRQIEASPRFYYEKRRKERLGSLLEKARQHLAAARVSIPVEADTFTRKTTDLPEGIRLERGRLTVEFQTAEELLKHLFELAQSIANDYERFRFLVEPPPPP